ncbi:MAG TPA: DUF3488 and transglutaminase-like domain-containing protein [Pirellulaceae bacterium]|nr:DUF3488 and transglutaminase-like domain-containing protein [Pirellulaceae bacterium]
MIDVERKLQWNIAILVVLGAALLGFGEDGGSMALIAAIGAGFSLLFVDRLKWFHLGRFSSNAVALLVAVYPLFTFFGKPNDQQLMSIAQLLVHLQVVLLLERKTPRIYWQLFVLSVLQVVVASALRFDLNGGGVFLLYVLTAFSAMILMQIHRDSERVAAAAANGRRRLDEVKKMLESDRPAAALRTVPISFFERKRPAREIVPQWRSRSLVTTVASALFASFLFFLIPRTGEPWVGARTIRLSMVGFSDKVTFGEDGRIQEGDSMVMRVSYRDPITLQPVPIGSDVYLRGLTLVHYGRERAEMTWTRGNRANRGGAHSTIGVRVRRPDTAGILIQEVVLEPTDERYLFTEAPADHFERNDQRIEFDKWQGTIAINGTGSPNTTFRYRLAVSAFRSVPSIGVHVHKRSIPYLTRSIPGSRSTMSSDDQRELLQMPRSADGSDPLPTIRQLARNWTADDIDPDDHRALALRIEEKLRAGGFEYTLDFTDVVRDEALDPLEDFVRNHRKGHCEYFAGTMALMLRSLGIPCRLVMGYRVDSDDYNELGGFYEVRSRNAHVWVEAYLAPQDITDEMLASGEAAPTGAWLHLDPTPGSSGEIAEQMQEMNLARRADQAFGYAQMIWDDYVVGLDAERQSRSMTGPWGTFLDPARWSEDLEEAFAQLPIAGNVSSTTLAAAVAVVVLIVLLFGAARRPALDRLKRGSAARLLRRIAPRLADWLAVPEPPAERPVIPFWQRFERLLERRGRTRGVAETPREFLARVAAEFAGTSGNETLLPAFEQVGNAYHEARFGQRPPTEEGLIEIELALDRIQERLGEPA